MVWSGFKDGCDGIPYMIWMEHATFAIGILEKMYNILVEEQ